MATSYRKQAAADGLDSYEIWEVVVGSGAGGLCSLKPRLFWRGLFGLLPGGEDGQPKGLGVSVCRGIRRESGEIKYNRIKEKWSNVSKESDPPRVGSNESVFPETKQTKQKETETETERGQETDRAEVGSASLLGWRRRFRVRGWSLSVSGAGRSRESEDEPEAKRPCKKKRDVQLAAGTEKTHRRWVVLTEDSNHVGQCLSISGVLKSP
ncbi:hypothetical protein DFH07DRAFT_979397 [Mycena maculata]|uniref:Uncharacterized protein n=1 Tax=Mycena maculata TaxID=230809 RepID=A0AAD7ILF1_9AGAR|nr:hypothetical protein DFH07DRAFT_979397 [Mycena maculata]